MAASILILNCGSGAGYQAHSLFLDCDSLLYLSLYGYVLLVEAGSIVRLQGERCLVTSGGGREIQLLVSFSGNERYKSTITAG